MCLAVRTGSPSFVQQDTLLAADAAGLMSSLRRLKTCSRLKRTVKKRLIALIIVHQCHRKRAQKAFVRKTGDRRFNFHVKITRKAPKPEKDPTKS